MVEVAHLLDLAVMVSDSGVQFFHKALVCVRLVIVHGPKTTSSVTFRLYKQLALYIPLSRFRLYIWQPFRSIENTLTLGVNEIAQSIGISIHSR